MRKAITFDFWDTLVHDESDEPKRAAQKRVPKVEARRALFIDDVLAHHGGLARAAVERAYDDANDWARQRWRRDHVTPSVAQRLAEGYRRLALPPAPSFSRLVAEFEFMEVDIPPNWVEGVGEALATLAETYRLGIISDTIITPGRGLVRLLTESGLIAHFTAAGLIFSDEAGHSKPSPKVFELACRGLGVEHHELVHVGDREVNDIEGPKALGMGAVLYTGAKDRGEETIADAVCRRMTQLPAIIASLK